MVARLMGVAMFVGGVYLMPWPWQVETHPVAAGIAVVMGWFLMRKGTFDASSW